MIKQTFALLAYLALPSALCNQGNPHQLITRTSLGTPPSPIATNQEFGLLP